MIGVDLQTMKACELVALYDAFHDAQRAFTGTQNRPYSGSGEAYSLLQAETDRMFGFQDDVAAELRRRVRAGQVQEHWVFGALAAHAFETGDDVVSTVASLASLLQNQKEAA